MFFGRRGAGEVMGRSRFVSDTVREAMEGKPANVAAGKDDSGIKLTGESGEEEGDGSESDEVSVHDTVVVGDDSADSEFWVEVLSLCL